MQINLENYPQRPDGYNFVIHKECGRPAFYYDGIPGRGQGNLRSDKARLLNGAFVRDGDQVFCGSCGRKVYTNEMHWLVPKVA